MKRTGLMLAAFGLILFAQAALADWTPTKRLTWNSGDSRLPAIAVDSSGNIHIVWQDDTPGNSEIYYKKSTNGGSTWMTSQRLTWNSGASGGPAIAVDASGNLHVVWEDDGAGNEEIYYMKSSDGGTTWSGKSQRLSWTSGLSRSPVIAADSSDNIHAVWADTTPGKWEIYYTKSTDGGSTWMTSQRITWNTGLSWFPDIAVDPSGHIHVVWEYGNAENIDIFYKKSTNGGATWLPGQGLTWNSGASQYPALTADSSGKIHVAWQDDTPGRWEINYRKSTDGGSTWMTGKRITWNTGASLGPAVSVDSSGNPHLVWEDDAPGNPEIYYRKSTNGGSTWMTSQRLTWNSDYSLWPEIAVDTSGNVHLAWYDYTPGNAEIYYRRYIQ